MVRRFSCLLLLLAQISMADEFRRTYPVLKLLPDSLLKFYWAIPDISSLANDRLSEEILYGRDLIIRTAFWIGPRGRVGKYLGNRMNCQNCHLDAGTRPFGGLWTTTHARYPQYRERDDTLITLLDRVNQCIKRPHNGRALEYNSREMRAMVAYIMWLGSGKRIGQSVLGDSLVEIPVLKRAADPEMGKTVYQHHCVKCHGRSGEGKLEEGGESYLFPPLWGSDSYSIGSSMHRIRKAAGFIKFNMPFGVHWKNTVLSDEQAYDVAAFINDERINPRPLQDISQDYPNLDDKPIDYQYGPYQDPFSEEQHRFGPYGPIKRYYKQRRKLSNQQVASTPLQFGQDYSTRE